MNPALVLIATYIVITAVLQFVGFVVSWLVEMVYPTFGLATFLALFLSMFWLAWPIAVRISGAWAPEVGPGAPRPGSGS
ncbi:MAG: hypothetical protein GEU91_18250 [Rhizobiales bacterium]|nr:hypothetical protein [Hyphomicrobiales bacterium]